MATKDDAYLQRGDTSSRDVRRFQGASELSEQLPDIQAKLAYLSEIIYLNIFSYPELASKVRIAAVKGREMHNKALALMTEFHQKAEGVVEAIELIKEFSDEGEIEIVEEYIKNIISWCEEMKTEANDVRDGYTNLIQQAQDIAGHMEAMQGKQKKMEADLQRSKDEQVQIKRDLQMQVSDLEKEEDKIHEAKVTLLQQVSIENSPFGALLSFFASNTDSIKRKEDAKYEARKAEKRREVLLAEKAASELALKQLNENIRHLQENNIRGSAGVWKSTVKLLMQVDTLLNRLVDMWSTTALGLSSLLKKTTKGEPMIKKLDNPRIKERFKKTIEEAREVWVDFDMACKKYVNVCLDPKSTIDHKYRFLDGRVEDMTIEQREEQIKTTKKEFE